MEGAGSVYNIGTVLELDDNKSYAVVSNISCDDKRYLYLVDIDDNSNVMFCESQNDELVFVNDKNLVQKLLLLVAKEFEDN